MDVVGGNVPTLTSRVLRSDRTESFWMPTGLVKFPVHSVRLPRKKLLHLAGRCYYFYFFQGEPGGGVGRWSATRTCMCVRVCVCVCVGGGACVCVCVCVRERERESGGEEWRVTFWTTLCVIKRDEFRTQAVIVWYMRRAPSWGRWKRETVNVFITILFTCFI